MKWVSGWVFLFNWTLYYLTRNHFTAIKNFQQTFLGLKFYVRDVDVPLMCHQHHAQQHEPDERQDATDAAQLLWERWRCCGRGGVVPGPGRELGRDHTLGPSLRLHQVSEVTESTLTCGNTADHSSAHLGSRTRATCTPVLTWASRTTTCAREKLNHYDLIVAAAIGN